jgi:sterol desaturase/sphingolipid hydroxylase (fatty acid hydroxylase superfamily)
MPATTLEQIIPQLRDAVGPVILISGVGLLLLTMTNRLGRAIDRARQMTHELAAQSGQERARTQAQVDIIYRRARIIRLAILFSVTSALLAAVLVMTLFLAAWLHWPQSWPAGVVFTACLASLCVSLVAFMGDINLSLHALKLELAPVPPEK